jgi:hypothetical protein
LILIQFLFDANRTIGGHLPTRFSERPENLPLLCFNQLDNRLIVSTVHRAKGSEADAVFWLDEPLVFKSYEGKEGTKADAIKAAYVAMTRAKTDLRLVAYETSNEFLKRLDNGRWIMSKFSRKTHKEFCAGIAMAPDDVDILSFADGERAEEKQRILSSIQPGSKLKLLPDKEGNCYNINFDGCNIGRASRSFMQTLEKGYDATNKNRNWPEGISSVYVSAVTTIVVQGEADVHEKYRRAGCWLGLELGGLGKIVWPKPGEKHSGRDKSTSHHSQSPTRGLYYQGEPYEVER